MKLVDCKGCGQKIFFIKTSNGKSMPLDAKPVFFYQEVLGSSGRIGWTGSQGYVPHWATCKKAKDFKKALKKKVIDKLEAGDHSDLQRPEPIYLGESHKWTSIPAPVRKCKAAGHETKKNALGNFNYELRCELCNYVYRYKGVK